VWGGLSAGSRPLAGFMSVLRRTWRSELRKLVEQNWKVGQTFSLDEVYSLAAHFRRLYPSNKHVREKLRQIMQQLRDEGLVEFIDDWGNSRRISK
jgi:type II restriction enzyme